MIFTLRRAVPGDREGWLRLDRHIDPGVLERKLREGEGLVLERDGEIVGILRWNLFWDSVPFCTLLYLREDARGQGDGRMLLEAWEREMKARGHGMVMTSTQADESAQHFYRKLGYRDAGGFVVNVPGYEQPLELVMIKGV